VISKLTQCRGGGCASSIRTGFGPENITRLRRFAIGILRSFQELRQSLAKMMRNHAFISLVFNYLRMTQNSVARACNSENKFAVPAENDPLKFSDGFPILGNYAFNDCSFIFHCFYQLASERPCPGGD
jgi:hypothetical protein